MAIVTGNPIGLLLTLTYTVGEEEPIYAPNWQVTERKYYMNFARKQSTTDYPIIFWMADSTDHVTGKTGLTPTVTISKNGGAFGAASGAVSEIANGWYSLAGNATDRNTLGSLAINAAATGADDADLLCQIVSYDPFADIAAILTDTGTTLDGKLNTIDGIVDDILVDTGTTIPATLTTIDDFLDTEVAAILEDTGTTIPAQISGLNNLSAANVNAELVDVLRTDTIPDSYATDGSQPTMAQAVLAIWQFLTEKSVSGTTVTVNKPDGSTAAMTFTLDSATAPTAITRAS